MKTDASKSQAKVAAQSDVKEKENCTATDLSKNLNEAVQKSLVKSSTDEVQSSPN
jgi:hypothetical protein